MATPNEFWLSLHTLADAYEEEGATRAERAENIANEFREMPPTVRREIRAKLDRLAVGLADVSVQVATAERATEPASSN